jgi:predicted XRE-type DNA-binding protein
MKTKQNTEIVRGTNNIFADLGYADAETHLLKVKLVTRIQKAITAQKLTQVAAAKRMGLSQPDVSRLLNGQFREISVERLMRLLTRLGCDVDITIRTHGKRALPRDTIHLQAATV